VARADTLPQTASPLPMSGLIGLLSLAGAAVLRVRRL
jgi:LPXTG-motif cell wall-anchored protein